MSFAFMFIPAEGVYYNLLNAEVGSTINSVNLIEYAFGKHVLIVSPTSFLLTCKLSFWVCASYNWKNQPMKFCNEWMRLAGTFISMWICTIGWAKFVDHGQSI